MKKKKNDFSLVVVGLLLIGVVIYFITYDNPTKKQIDNLYEKTELGVSFIKITDLAEVRAEPMIIGDDRSSNSFGPTKELNFTMEIDKVYKTNKNLDSNGIYYGVPVDEITMTAEGLNWFPGEIVNDPDGIVWINHKSIEIIS